MADAGGDAGGAAERADRGLPGRVPRRRRLRGARRDPRGDADLLAREPRARRGGPARRGRPGRRRRLAVRPGPPPSRPTRSSRAWRGRRSPQQPRAGCARKRSRVDRHVHVGGEDRDQRGDQPPARRRGACADAAPRRRRRSRRRRSRTRARACAGSGRGHRSPRTSAGGGSAARRRRGRRRRAGVVCASAAWWQRLRHRMGGKSTGGASAPRHEQARVAVRAAAREALRAAALGVEEGELARDAREPAAVVVEHPRLEHVAVRRPRRRRSARACCGWSASEDVLICQ